MRLKTQWHVSAMGRRPIGMRYDSLPLMLRIEAVPRADWPQVVTDLQAIEAELLRMARAAGRR